MSVRRLFPLAIAVLLISAFLPLKAYLSDKMLNNGGAWQWPGSSRILSLPYLGSSQSSALFKKYDESVESSSLKDRGWWPGERGLDSSADIQMDFYHSWSPVQVANHAASEGPVSGMAPAASGGSRQGKTFAQAVFYFGGGPARAEAGSELARVSPGKENSLDPNRANDNDEEADSATTVFYRPWPRRYVGSNAEDTPTEKVIAALEGSRLTDESQEAYTQFYAPWPGKLARDEAPAGTNVSRQKKPVPILRAKPRRPSLRAAPRAVVRPVREPTQADEINPGRKKQSPSVLVRAGESEHLVPAAPHAPVPPVSAKGPRVDEKPLRESPAVRESRDAEKEKRAPRGSMPLRRAYVTGFPPRVIFRDGQRDSGMSDIKGIAKLLESAPSRSVSSDGKTPSPQGPILLDPESDLSSLAPSASPNGRTGQQFMQLSAPFVSGWPPRPPARNVDSSARRGSGVLLSDKDLTPPGSANQERSGQENSPVPAKISPQAPLHLSVNSSPRGFVAPVPPSAVSYSSEDPAKAPSQPAPAKGKKKVNFKGRFDSPTPVAPAGFPALAENAPGNGTIVPQGPIPLAPRSEPEPEPAKPSPEPQKKVQPAPVSKPAQTSSEPRPEEPLPAPRKVSHSSDSDRPKSEKPQEAALVEQGAILLPQGTMQIEPTFEWTHFSDNRVAIGGFTLFEALVIGTVRVDSLDRDILSASVSARYGLFDRLQAEIRVPYIYRRDREILAVGSGSERGRTISGSDIGDIEGSVSWQAFLGDGAWPAVILKVRGKSRTGKDSFEIETESVGAGSEIRLKEPPTGSGFYSVTPGFTLVWKTDPVVLFMGSNYSYNFERKIRDGLDIDPGDTIEAFAGLNVALNERISINMAFINSFTRSSRNNGSKVRGTDATDSRISLGTSIGLSSNLSLLISAAIGLTEESPDLQFTFSLPFTFSLF